MSFKPVEFLSSVWLALCLLILIVLVCVFGVVFLRFPENKEVIFFSLWFNSLLALLVVNIIFCFFSRLLRRRLSLTSLGLMVFHLSMVLLCVGAIYDGLFFLRGS